MNPTVSKTLQAYADRGIFRGFGSHDLARGRIEYRFLWHTETPHRLRLDQAGTTLHFVDLLPGVPFRSPMDRELRAFLSSRGDPSLPEHRRLDPKRIAVRAINRQSRISIEARSLDGDLAYATSKLIKLVNEIFMGFLAGPYESYMVEHFGAPEE